MTLNFQMRGEDLLAFNREYQSGSQTYQRTRTRVRLTFPAIMLGSWLFTISNNGFEWISTVIFFGVAVLWYFLYPARFDRNVERYTQKMLDEPSNRKILGSCKLTLSESGMHSKSNLGESTLYWSAVDRALLTETHLFIILNGSQGFPIRISDVGEDAAKAAYDYAISHKTTMA